MSAVEYALLSPLFIALLVSALVVSYVEFARAQLDQASEIGKRVVLTGKATNLPALQKAVCGAIGGLVSCNQTMISLTPYSSFAAVNTANPTLTYNADGSVANAWSQNFGASGSIMVLQLIYQLPVFGAPLFGVATQSNGNFLLVSTQVFVRE